MEKTYRVVITYPDGHIEEVQEHFKNGADALEYGNSILAQIPNTERYRSPFDDDKKEASFVIVEVYNNKQKIVYTSK